MDGELRLGTAATEGRQGSYNNAGPLHFGTTSRLHNLDTFLTKINYTILRMDLYGMGYH